MSAVGLRLYSSSVFEEENISDFVPLLVSAVNGVFGPSVVARMVL